MQERIAEFARHHEIKPVAMEDCENAPARLLTESHHIHRRPQMTKQEIEDAIVAMVREARAERLRPRELFKLLGEQHGLTWSAARRALSPLLHDQRLVYTYRDPCSFVELPPS